MQAITRCDTFRSRNYTLKVQIGDDRKYCPPEMARSLSVDESDVVNVCADLETVSYIGLLLLICFFNYYCPSISP